MKKELIILIILTVIPNVSALQINYLDSMSTNNDIRGLETNSHEVYFTTKNSIGSSSSDRKWNRNYNQPLSWEIDSNKRHVLTGSRGRGSELLLYSKKGKLLESINHKGWTDGVGLYSVNNSTLLSSGSGRSLEIYYKNGTKFSDFKSSELSKHPKNSLIDTSIFSGKQIIVSGSGNPRGGKVKLIDLQGQETWSTGFKDSRFVKGDFIPKNGVLVYWGGGLELRSDEGRVKWSRSDTIGAGPVNLSDSIVYGSGNKLVYLDYEGRKVDERVLEEPVRVLKRFPGRELLVGYQGGNLSFFSLGGKRLGSFGLGGVDDKPMQFTDYDRDGSDEVVVAGNQRIEVLDIDFRPSVDQDLGETVFVGRGSSMLEAAALNRTSFVTDNVSSVDSELESLDSKALGVGAVSGVDSIRSPNRAFNQTGCFYVESREKAIYLSAVAAEKDSCLTFDKDLAGKDYTNKSVGEVKSEFIDVFEPNHLVLADFSSEKGVLAAYMAVRQGSMPVDVDREKRYNAVILRDRINQTFQKIGENQNTVFDGRYVSILSGPKTTYTDPVEQGFFEDPADGKNFSSDLFYGDLTGDGYLDLGIGRYPEKVSSASKVFHRSRIRSSEKRALVASEYLSTDKKVVLATLGGGMRYGSRIDSLFRRQGFNTTHLVEYRSEPVKFMMGLTPGATSSFIKDTKRLDAQVSHIGGSKAGSAVRRLAILLKAIDYNSKGLEMYYEFKWVESGFSAEKGLERLKDYQVPDGRSLSEMVEKSVVDALYSFLWPEKHPELTQKSLKAGMADKDIIYYQGRGNSAGWQLPENGSYSQDFGPKDIPELENTIVWDSANKAGVSDGAMRSSFFENGASAHIGFSSINYGSYSSLIDHRFFKTGDTLGSSLKSGLNYLRSAKLVYTPVNAYRSGLQSKLASSLNMYGNPEMRKDPIDDRYFNSSRSCKGHKCSLDVDLDPELKIEGIDDSKTVVSNASTYLRVPGRPEIPLYSLKSSLPAGSSIENIEVESSYRQLSDVELHRTRFLSNGGGFINRSRTQGGFPSVESNTSVSGNDLRWVQAGIKTHDGQIEVLESGSIEVEYSSPVVLELDRDGRNLSASIRSDRAGKAQLIYSLDGKKQSKDISLREGEKSLDLGELEYGENRVEAYVVNKSVLDSVEKSFVRARALEPELVSGSLVRGSSETVSVKFENPNSFSVRENISLGLGNSSVLGFMEESSREVSVGPNSSKVVSWDLIGLEDSSRFSVSEEDSWELDVRPAASESFSLDGLELDSFVGSENNLVRYYSNSSGSVVEISSDKGFFKHYRTSKKVVSRVETSSFSARSVREDKKIVRRVETGSGSFTSIESGGKFVKKGSLDRFLAERYLSVLESESEKASVVRRGLIEG